MTGRDGAKRRPIVLFHPRDEGPAMPLGLLALGSWLKGEHVVVVDGRFELAPEARIVELAGGALCLGVTVRTGAQLGEARRVSAAALAANPGLAVVWGGPHATLDPASCLESGVVNACALGAGEEALEAAAATVRAGQRLRSGRGLVVAAGDPMDASSPPTTLWPRADYALLDVERHFEIRGARRLDYCSSRGARDGSDWMSIRAERVAAEARELGERYRLSEILFQDEDFFADAERVEAIASGLLEGGGTLGWQARTRPEDAAAAPPARLRLLKESGCRRLHLRVAAGAGTEELLMEAGARLHAARLPARFAFDVGQPGKGRDELGAAVTAARRLCALDGHFETPIRRAWSLARPPGGVEGRSLDRWAAAEGGRWPDPGDERRIARVAFFFGEAQRAPSRRLGKQLVRLLALLRVRIGFFGLDFERLAVEASAILRTGRARRPAVGD